jgi:hypothetical protein
MNPNRAQRVYRDPRVYQVGVDISEERYHEALLKIADWFAESRKTTEPALLAKQMFQLCLDGRQKNGQKWWGAGDVSLEGRVKVMCRFDLETMTPLRKASEKTRRKKALEKQAAQKRKLRDKEAARQDPMIPPEVRKTLGASVLYGDNPHVLLTSEEAAKWKELHAAYLEQFPELRTVNASSELSLVCDLQILAERYRLKALQGSAVAVNDLADITKQLAGLKTALGIHPDQISKRAKSRIEGTIGAAAARLDSLGNWREIRAKYFIEELIQTFQMYQMPKADGSGYQLDEVGFFGVHKCRTCHCAGCGMRNMAGVSVEEVERYLVEKGALVPLGKEAPPPVPTGALPADRTDTGTVEDREGDAGA